LKSFHTLNVTFIRIASGSQRLDPYNIPMQSSDAPRLFIGRTDSENQQFDAWAHQPLLLSMEQGGIVWPSSCRNGTCRSCFGQLTSGQVRYHIEWPGLSAEEKAEGFILPCVAHPCSDVVLRNDN
jgi:ferredoxin